MPVGQPAGRHHCHALLLPYGNTLLGSRLAYFLRAVGGLCSNVGIAVLDIEELPGYAQSYLFHTTLNFTGYLAIMKISLRCRSPISTVYILNSGYLPVNELLAGRIAVQGYIQVSKFLLTDSNMLAYLLTSSRCLGEYQRLTLP